MPPSAALVAVLRALLGRLEPAGYLSPQESASDSVSEVLDPGLRRGGPFRLNEHAANRRPPGHVALLLAHPSEFRVAITDGRKGQQVLDDPQPVEPGGSGGAVSCAQRVV